MKKLLFVIFWYLMVQSSEPCTTPIWFEMDFGDGVTHLWSRSVYFDYNGIRKKTNDIINKKWDGKSIEEINYYNVVRAHNESVRKNKLKLDSLMKVVMN